jgi:hypothetical protein
MKKKILFLLMLILSGLSSCNDGVLDAYDDSVVYNLRDRGPAGGWIFYINPNYKQDGWRYLEAAPVSTERMSIQFGTYCGTATGITDSAIGTGKSNTARIVAWLNNNIDDYWGDVTNRTNRAAYLCYNLEVIYDGVSYHDWFLPSRDELSLIFNNLYVAGIGNFEDAIQRLYWSSTEGSNTDAYRELFPEGTSATVSKASSARVRAIRRF